MIKDEELKSYKLWAVTVKETLFKVLLKHCPFFLVPERKGMYDRR